GILGAIDDYLSIVGGNEGNWKRAMRPTRIFFYGMSAVIIVCGLYLYATGGLANFFSVGFLSPFIAIPASILALAYLGACTALLDDWVKGSSGVPYKKGGIAALPKI